MAALLVLKMGTTLPSLKSARGDFEDWIISGLGLARDEAHVIDVAAGEALPSNNGHAGIVVTGSHSMITERRDWSENAAAWLRCAVNAGEPVLGICYGHQLLAHALGGEVGNNPKGREFGTVQVALNDAARDDALLGGLSPLINVHVGHTQSVLRLPQDAVRLASNPWDLNQAVRFGPAAWGVQFHPEFDAGIVTEYIRHFQPALSAEGQDTARLAADASETSFGPMLLRRFAALAGKS